ncbi:uncharacterized protein [Ranitomeya imitator]|uniref:uncharacterized protein n=1 Tax=Ranitomeya imitator TaxID=111125 RepID=UPI0037E96376
MASGNTLQVINLTDYELSATELSVLQRGLTFSPAQTADKFTLIKDLYLFCRNLVLRVLHNRPHLLGNSDQTDQQTLQDLIQLLQENEPDTGSTEECCQFIDFLNTNTHNIFLTHSMSSSTVTFLDLQVILENGSIVTKLFRKPTATNSLLDYRSFHPVHTRMGVPTGQFLRVRRNCTDDSDFQREARELTTRFKNRHYPHGSISRAYQRASAHTQDSLLEPRTRVLYRTYLGESTWNLLWRNMPMLIWD